MASTPISPKVTAGSAVAAIIGLLLQYSVTITPDTFAFLGKGQGLAFMVVTLGAGALAAWWKTDPLRGTAAPDPVPAALPVVTTVSVESVPTLIHVDEPAPASVGAHAAP
jgi:hypothetical protein